MVCSKCSNRMVMHAFSKGECILCKNTFTSGFTPANKLCTTCSESEESICATCGNKIVVIKADDIKVTIGDDESVKMVHMPSSTSVESNTEEIARWNRRRCINELLDKLSYAYCKSDEVIMINGDIK